MEMPGKSLIPKWFAYGVDFLWITLLILCPRRLVRAEKSRACADCPVSVHVWKAFEINDIAQLSILKRGAVASPALGAPQHGFCV